MGINQLYNDNLRKLPNEYEDVSVMTYIGSVLFRTSGYTCAKQASKVPFGFRDLSRQNQLVPGHLVPFFRPGQLVPLFGSPRPIFDNGVLIH